MEQGEIKLTLSTDNFRDAYSVYNSTRCPIAIKLMEVFPESLISVGFVIANIGNESYIIPTSLLSGDIHVVDDNNIIREFTPLWEKVKMGKNIEPFTFTLKPY